MPGHLIPSPLFGRRVDRIKRGRNPGAAAQARLDNGGNELNAGDAILDCGIAGRQGFRLAAFEACGNCMRR